MSALTPGQAAFAAYYGRSAGRPLKMPESWDMQPGEAQADWEAAAQAAINAARVPSLVVNFDEEVTEERAAQIRQGLDARSLDGLMPMGLHFDDADPVARCLVGDCRWHGHGDSMTDAVTAWAKHLGAVHRQDWPED